jgi:hypothetical protein
MPCYQKPPLQSRINHALYYYNNEGNKGNYQEPNNTLITVIPSFPGEMFRLF